MLCVGLFVLVTANSQTLNYRYWFDGQYEACRTDGATIDDTFLRLEIDVSSLDVGLHTLTLMTNDSSGQWGPVYEQLFFRVPDTTITELDFLYWFDNDNSTMLSNDLVGNMILLDVSALSVGLHSVNIYIEGGNTPQNYVFFKVEDTIGIGYRYHYWFDGDISTLQSDGLQGTTFQIDVASLSEGIHTITVQIERGARSAPLTYLFFKIPILDSTERICRYWFDDNHAEVQTTPSNSDPLLLDVSALDNGLHFVNIQFGGVDVPPLRQLFYKNPNGGIGVTKYEYCLNGEWENRHTHDITAVDTFRLISLLPVDTLPIRSSCFEFDPNNGVPVVYAKNDINFRFWDNEYRFVETNGSYVDMNVVDTVYADTLERDTTKVITAPINNNIHWFKLAAGRGDSLSFHTDRRCTMQLYAPSGEMVFHTSGDSVLSWDGCHAWEDGIYYLAVHDAEGTGMMSVSYQWIYRYAVLAWDVHRVGNGGVSTITFEGNGFASLDTIFLVKGTDTIPTLYIDRKSNTTVSVIYNFENADTGMYNAMFMYLDENLYKTNVVMVDTAIPIVLTTNVSFPGTFLRGSTVTYTLEITNTGNMTAYNVPIFTYIGSPTLNSISHIKYDGLFLPSIIADFNIDSLSTEEIAELKEWAEKVGDDHYFYRIKTVDSVSGDTIYVRSNYFFFTIAPYETKILSLSITTVDSVDVWFTLPDTVPNSLFSSIDLVHQHLQLHGNKSDDWLDHFRDNYCCVRENIECVITLISNTLDIGSLLLDAATMATAALGRVEVAAVLLELAGGASVASCVASGINTN